jgi:putative addiction module component (TIGR02574 family)
MVMSAALNLNRLMDDVLLLPHSARALLAEKLLESLDVEDEGEISPEWEAELRKRMEDVRSGKVRMIPAEQVRTELDALLLQQQ